jgi:hypothetical protein
VQRLDAILRVFLQLRGAGVRATLLGRIALVAAEEDGALVVALAFAAFVEASR